MAIFFLIIAIVIAFFINLNTYSKYLNCDKNRNDWKKLCLIHEKRANFYLKFIEAASKIDVNEAKIEELMKEASNDFKKLEKEVSEFISKI
jgi:hypothetical protein